MSEAKHFKEYLKCDINNFNEFKGVQLEKMFSNQFNQPNFESDNNRYLLAIKMNKIIYVLAKLTRSLMTLTCVIV